MNVLDVVQPEDFDPSGFTVTDGKLKVAISSKEGNILVNHEDGLYAPSGETDGVLGRYIYTFDGNGNAVHKGINFHVFAIDGALQGQVHGINFDDVTPDDVIFYNGQYQSAEYDDEKYVIGLPWGVEHMQRVILKLHKDGKPVLWVAKVIRNKNSGFGELGVVDLIIDEMVNVGDLTSNSEAPPVDGDITIMGYSNTVSGDRIAIIGMQDNRIGIARVEGEDGSVSIADTRFGTLAANYSDLASRNIKAYMGYCPLLGYLLYHDGKNYNLMLGGGGTPAVTDLPDPDFNTGTAGVGLSLNSEGEGAYFYSMDAQSFSYQRILNTSPLEFSSVTTIDAPTEGIIEDYLVSGAKAVYLLIKNGMYVLHITDLSNSDVTEYPLMSYNEEDQRAKLINGSVGSVFAYIDKVQAQVLVGVVATLDMSTFTLNITQMEPTVLDGPLLSIDPLSHVSLHLDQTFTSYGMFLSPEDMSIVRVGSSLMTGGVEVAKAPIPADYLALLTSGKMSIPFTGGQTAIAYDASPNGHNISFGELEIGDAGGGMYQSLAMPLWSYTYYALAVDKSGGLNMFPLDSSSNKLIKLNTLRGSNNHAIDPTAGMAVAIHHESSSFTFLDANRNVVLASPDSGDGFYNLTVLGQADQNRPPTRLVLNQSLFEEDLLVTAWFKDTREVTVYKISSDMTVTPTVITLEELPEEIEMDGHHLRELVNSCQVGRYLVYALPTKQGEEKANNELLIIDLVTGTKEVVFHSEAGYDWTLNLTAISDVLFTTDVLLVPVEDDVENYQQRKLWKIESDFSITEMDTLNLPSFNSDDMVANSQRYLTANGEIHHDIGILANSESPKYLDVVTDIPSAKMAAILLSPTEEMTNAAGIFSNNGMPQLGYFQFDEMGKPKGICIQGDLNLSTFAFHPFDTSNGGGGEDNTPKEPRTLLGVYGDKGLMVNEANGDLYVAPFNSAQVVGSPVGAMPSGNIPTIKKKLAIDSETGYYAYMKGWDVVFGSIERNNVLSTITVATTSREAEVAEITSIKSRDGTKVIFLIFIPAEDLTGDAKHWRYEVDIMSGSVASKGLTRLNGRGGTISSVGIAITDKWIITHHPGEDGLIYLGPHDAGIVSKQHIAMGNTSIDRLVTIGDNLFGVVYKDIPNSELPFLVFEVSDDGKVETKHYFTVDTDKVLIGGGLGPNSAFRKLGPGKYRAAVTLIGSGDYYNHVGFIDLNEGGRSTMGGDLVTLPEGVNLENLYTTIIGSSVDKIFYQAEPSKAEPGTTLSPYLG